MKEQINVALVQPDLLWEDVEGNLEQMENWIGQVKEDTDLVILPETFSTGFTMRADRFAEDISGKAVSWMKKVAVKRQLVITGSLILRDGDRIYNRLLWVGPEGLEGFYDKRHLFRMGREDRFFVSGTERVLLRLEDFRFMPQICYDLRFPVFARNRGDYDVLFYVANWPAPRHGVWETLLRARAMENQAYVIGVSRSGRDGEGVDHLGGSCLVDPTGKILEILGPEPGLLQFSLDIKKIRELREKFPVWRDADSFSLDPD